MLCADTDRGARAKLPSRRTYLADDTNMPGTQSHQPLPRTVDDVDSDDDYDIQVRKRLQQGTGRQPFIVSDDDEEENVPPPKPSPRQSSVSDGIECVKKPDCVLDYNAHMCGVDRIDQLLSYYSPLRKTLKWYRKVVLQTFDMGMSNAFLL